MEDKNREYIYEKSMSEDGFSSHTTTGEILVSEIQSRWETDEYSIQQSYNIDTLVVLPVNVNTNFLYWEITQGLLDKHNNPQNLVLKLFNAENSSEIFHKSINSYTDSFYLSYYLSSQSIYARIGYLDSNSNFIIILQSNTIKTPSDNISFAEDEVWLIKKEGWTEIMRSSIEHVSIGRSSASFTEEMEFLKNYQKTHREVMSSHTNNKKG